MQAIPVEDTASNPLLEDDQIDLTTNPPSPIRRSVCYTGVIPLNDKSVNSKLDIIFKYGSRTNPEQGHEWKIVGNSLQANIYGKDCTGYGVIHTYRYHTGVRRCLTLQLLRHVEDQE